MTTTAAATIDSLQSVPADQGDHRFFLNHLGTVKVAAGGSASGLALVEFVAPRGFGPPRHLHVEEDELITSSKARSGSTSTTATRPWCPRVRSSRCRTASPTVGRW